MISSVVDMSQFMAAAAGNTMLPPQPTGTVGGAGVGASEFRQTDFGSMRAQGVGAKLEAYEASGVVPAQGPRQGCFRHPQLGAHPSSSAAPVNGAKDIAATGLNVLSSIQKAVGGGRRSPELDIEAMTRSNRETIGLQIKVQEVSLRSEMLSKMAEHATGSTKTVLQTQT